MGLFKTIWSDLHPKPYTLTIVDERGRHVKVVGKYETEYQCKTAIQLHVPLIMHKFKIIKGK